MKGLDQRAETFGVHEMNNTVIIKITDTFYHTYHKKNTLRLFTFCYSKMFTDRVKINMNEDELLPFL